MPAITAAIQPVDRSAEPGVDIAVLDSFSAPPAAVVYVMRRETMSALGGWEEEYEIASGEDVDLCFKVWVNDLDVVFDERVLVAHVGHATASRLDDWPQLWAVNRRRFLAKWMGPSRSAALGIVRTRPLRGVTARPRVRRGLDGQVLHDS